jgi:hypothetical protein
MWNDEIVEEVRKVRREHAAAHGHDLRRIFQDLKKKQDESGRDVVTLDSDQPRNARCASGSTSKP